MIGSAPSISTMSVDASMPLGFGLQSVYSLACATSRSAIIAAMPSVERTCRALGVERETSMPPTRDVETLAAFKQELIAGIRPALEAEIFARRFAETAESFRAARIPDANTIRAIVEKTVIGEKAADVLLESASLYADVRPPFRHRLGFALISLGCVIDAAVVLKMLFDNALAPLTHETGIVYGSDFFFVGLGLIAGGIILAAPRTRPQGHSTP